MTTGGPIGTSAELALRERIEASTAVDQVATAACGIAPLVRAALARGTDAAQCTAMISALNDAVTVRLVRTIAADTDVDLARACWIAFGSQARGEQTIATDQDNGLIFDAADAERDRRRWMAFGQRVNEALARCGYPLCDGRVMAGQPLCCLTQAEWLRRFEHWMAHGSANDLLAARIYFDLKPLAGNLALARPLQTLLVSPSAAVPRFVKQMADVVLCNHVPLNWLGRVVTDRHLGAPMFDLKMSGTALFVDAARLWALAHSIPATGTMARLRRAAEVLRVPGSECETWLRGFGALQQLRLSVQLERDPATDPLERTWVAWKDLGEAQRAALKSALRAARWVQQRIALDYRR